MYWPDCVHTFILAKPIVLSTHLNIKLENDKIKGGEWTSQAGQDGCLKSMKPPNSKRWPEKNFSERNSRKYFMNSEIRSMRWQFDYVRSVGETR